MDVKARISDGSVIIDGEKLSPEEVVFLVETGKLKLEGLEEYLSNAINTNPDFFVRYIVYSDLRERGYAVRPGREFFWLYPRGAQPGDKLARYIIRILRESDSIAVTELYRLIGLARNMRKELILAVVDEESDVTYYGMGAARLEGTHHDETAMVSCSLAGDRVLVHDRATAEKLHKDMYGKLMGDKLILSMIEAAYLMKRGAPDDTGRFMEYVASKDRNFKDKLDVYCDLRAKGLILKTGFKFGSHFRVYTASEQEHSSFLVHVLPHGYIFTMHELARAVRLAHGVKKRMVFAYVDNRQIRYIYIVRKKL